MDLDFCSLQALTHTLEDGFKKNLKTLQGHAFQNVREEKKEWKANAVDLM